MFKKIMEKNLFLKIILSLGIFALVATANVALAETCPSNTMVTGTTVVFVGELTDLGGDPTTNVWFQYGQTTGYGQETIEKTLTETGFYCITVNGLLPSTTYHYRAAARNTADTSYGEDKTFTTTSGPSVDLRINGSNGTISIPYNGSIDLTWYSSNVSSCYASDGWSGTKAVSGSESKYDLTSSKTYTINCTGSGGSVTDSVSVDVSGDSDIDPVADAGSDRTVYEDRTVTLNGSGYDPDGGSVTYRWSCTGGSLNNRYTDQPVFDAPSVSYDRDYTCTLTVEDDEGDTDSDSMIVTVRDREDDDDDELPIADAGSNKTVYEDETVTLNGSGYDPDGGSVTYRWSCSGGSLDYRYTDRPDFDAPSVSYNRNYTCTLTVTDDEGDTDSDSMTVSVKDEDDEDAELRVGQSVKNVSDGDTTWFNSLYADPGDDLLFRITVKAVGDEEARDVEVENILPSKIVYKGNLRIDGDYSSENINTDSIDIGDLSPNQTVIITFEGEVKSKSNFNYGTTNLISSATASNSDDSDTDTCKVMVKRSSVAGATDVRTGIDSKLFSSLLFPLGIAMLMVVIFKSQLIGFDKWSEKRKKQTQGYRNEKLLKKEIKELNI
jgi:hypothetical protein